MSKLLEHKKIILGVTGSIACYKSVELASRLVKEGAVVDTILTASAARFVTPLTFQGITHRPVITDLFEIPGELGIRHIELAKEADLIIIAPATANSIAKLALGLADDPLTTIAMATTAPLVIAPAMETNMYEHPALNQNLTTLRRRGAHVAGPASGSLASGQIGFGRMLEPEVLVGHISWTLGRNGDLGGRGIVVSAGGTQEPIDPVRVITNRSSGKMGYAIAEAARDRGARVTLITAATGIPDPIGVLVHPVTTVSEMRESVLLACQTSDALIMAAAVGDFSPSEKAAHKLKKDSKEDILYIGFQKNLDFFNEVPENVIRVGFAAETEDLITNATKKIQEKGLDFIVANDVTDPESGFGVDTNQVTFIDTVGTEERLPLLPKLEVAHRILDKLIKIME